MASRLEVSTEEKAVTVGSLDREEGVTAGSLDGGASWVEIGLLCKSWVSMKEQVNRRVVE